MQTRRTNLDSGRARRIGTLSRHTLLHSDLFGRRAAKTDYAPETDPHHD